MNFNKALFSLILLSPAVEAGGQIADNVQTAMDSPYRIEQDFEKDKTRHPGEVLTFMGIKSGMTVLDLFSGGGYYTTLMSVIVGEEGAVTAHNNAAYIPFAGEEMKQESVSIAKGGIVATA